MPSTVINAGLTVVCVNVGEKYSTDYTHILHSMCQRHIPAMQHFICFTDNVRRYDDAPFEALPSAEGLEDWWAKIGIHNKTNGLKGRVLYLDLDVVLVNNLTPLLFENGFWTLHDWLEPTCYNSSMMLFTAEDYYHLYDKFNWRDKGVFKTDQHYLTKHVPEAKFWTAPEVLSYKQDGCEEALPEGARVVVFHGFPKPLECDAWVKDYWK